MKLNNMKYGVIDIGSNSVRLMISEGTKTLYKLVKTTRLAEGMGEELKLKDQPIERTAHAVSFFNSHAIKEGVSNVYAFGTAALRQAKNADEFILRVKELCGLNVQVISGEMEAELGAKGALNGKDGAIVDVGGASTEITVVKNDKVIYCKSVDIGVVKIKDAVGQQKEAVTKFVKNKLLLFGEIPQTSFYAIGGTATSIASILLELDPYDPDKVDGFSLNIQQLEELSQKLFNMTELEKRNLVGLQPERSGVIAGGCAVLLEILKKANCDCVFVSEKDNLEGYLSFKLEKK